MTRHLPSLSALRAFDSSARHLSFTNAAIELNLTQTAISHRIKELERFLAVRLFDRVRNGIALTDAGREYLQMVRPAIAQIATATDNISSGRDNRLHISSLNAFAAHCLIPALPDFRRSHPNIAIRLKPILATGDSARVDFDVAIWHGVDDWPGFVIEKIGNDFCFPVCSPAYLAAHPDLTSPMDLARHTIVRTLSPMIADEWPAWLQYAGVSKLEFECEVHCDSLFLTLESAISGLGLCIGRRQLVRDALASGRLVAPFGIRSAATSFYYLVARAEKMQLPKVVAFRGWLLGYFHGRGS